VLVKVHLIFWRRKGFHYAQPRQGMYEETVLDQLDVVQRNCMHTHQCFGQYMNLFQQGDS